MIASLTTHELDDLVAATLRAPQPECELRGMVRALLASGFDREALIRDLNRRRLQMEAARREQEGSALFDVLDALAGWCGPGLEL